MLEDMDKLIKEKYDDIATSEYNSEDILNIINNAKVRKLKSFLVKIYSLILFSLIISIAIVECIGINIKNDNIKFLNVTGTAKNSMENNILNYSKILPKEIKTIIYSSTEAVYSEFDSEYKEYDYALIIEVNSELDYTYLYEIDDIPKTLFEVKVLENLKGELSDNIEIYTDGGMVVSNRIENGLNDSNSYTKYVPFNYFKIGEKYFVGINKVGDKLYVKDLLKYKLYVKY